MANDGTSSAIITVGADFGPAERAAQEFANKTQRLLSQKTGGSSLSRPLSDITESASKFEKTMASANARVIAFGAAAGIIFQVAGNIREMAAATVEVDKALTDINTLFQKSKQEISSFGAEIFKIAKDTGKSFSDIAGGAQELARQGLGAEDTLIRLKDAAILSRQSGLDLADSVETLTASINSFGKAALTSTEIVNKFANVDAAFAVSSRDLAEALKRVGSTAQDAGVSLDELIGLVTSAQQTTARGGAVIGNALKTIFTRIDRPEVLNQLEQVGVAVRKVSGEVEPASNILKSFAGVFDKASESQQSYLAELVGSVYQINILKALLGDLSKEYSIADRATKKSSLSQNEAIERNEAYNKSLSATLNRSKETFRQLGSQIGNLTLAPLVGTTSSLIDTLFGDVGKESTDIGGNIAEGVMKGIGNFISGPGLVAVAGLAGKLLSGFTAYAKNATVDLLGINKFSKDQVALEKDLIATLSAESGLRSAILKGSVSQVEAEKILLSITKQRVAEQSKLTGIAGASAGNLLKSGQLGFNKKGSLYVPNYSIGGVPNYASQLGYGALNKAIQREKGAGVPEALIRVGQDNALKSAKNPIGLGVFNLRDEPEGLKQGVERAVRMGIDPQKHGSEGSVPHFAASGYYQNINSKFSDPFGRGPGDQPVSPDKFQEIESEITKLKAQIKLGILSFEKLPAAVENLTSSFNLTKESSNLIQRKLESSARYYNSSSSQLIRDRNRPNLSAGLAPYGQAEVLPTSSGEQFQFQGLLNDVKRQGVQFQGQSLIASLMTPTPGDKRKIQKDYNDLVNDLLFNKNPKVSGAEQEAALPSFPGIQGDKLLSSKEVVDKFKRNREDAARRKAELAQPPVLSYPGPQGESLLSQKEETEKQAQASRDAIDEFKRRRQNIQQQKDLLARSVSQQSALDRQTASASSFSGFFTSQGRQDSRDLKALSPQAFAAARGSLNEKIGRRALGVSIGAPIVAGIASQLFDDSSPTQRGLSASVQGAGNVASYAGLGSAVIGGLPGLAVGAGAGLALELPSVIKAFSDNLPDLIKNFELASEKFKENSDTLTKYITLEDKLRDTRGITSDARARLLGQRDQSLASLNSEQRTKLGEAFQKNGVAGALGFQQDEELRNQKELKALELQTLIGGNLGTGKDKASILEGSLPRGARKVEFFQTAEQSRREAFNLSRPQQSGDIFRERDFSSFTGSSKRFFSPEEIKKSDKLSTLLATSLESNGKLLFSKETDSKVISSVREDLLKSVNSGDNKAVLDKLNSLIPDNNAANITTRAGLAASQQNSPDLFNAYIARFLRENLSENFAGERSKIESGANTSAVKQIGILSDFSSKLFKAIEAINSFTLSLENSNKLASQDSQFRQKFNSTLREGTLQARSPFITPLAQEGLQRSVDLSNLSEQSSGANRELVQNFSESLNKVISSEVIGELENKIRLAIGKTEGNSQEPKDIVNRAFDFTSPIVELNKNIQSRLSGGDVGGAEDQIQKLLDYLSAQNQKLLPSLQDVGGAKDSADLKSLIEKISAGISSSRQQFSQSGTILNSGIANNEDLIRLQSIQRENQLKIQKQIGFGGGPQGFLEDPNSFGRSLSRARTFESIGGANSSASLQGLGQFERAKNLQSLGVDVQSAVPDLFKSLVDNLAASIDQALLSAGVSLKGGAGQGNSRDIALKQLQAALPTDKAGGIEGLISTSQNLYKSIEANTSSLGSFVTIATEQGIKIQSESITALANAIAPGGGSKGGRSTDFILSNYQTFDKAPLPSLPFILDKAKEELSLGVRGLSSAGASLPRSLSPFQADRFPSSEKDVGSTVSKSRFVDSSEDSRRNKTEALLQLLARDGGVSNRTIQGAASTSSLFNNKEFNKNAAGFYGGLTPDLTGTQERLLSLSSDLEKVRQRLLSLSEKENEINKKVEAGEINVLEAARKRLALREQEITIETKAAFLRGEVSGQDYNSQLNRNADAKIKSNEFGLSDLGKTFGSELTSYNRQDYFTEVKDGAIDTAKTIKSEFAGAFKSFRTGTKDAGDAFRDFGLNILEKIADISTSITTNLLFSGIGSLFGSGASGFGTIFSGEGKSSGGIIGYSKGGKVKGGSGTKDDVPALLTQGEYVINKQSVNALGVSNLDRINSGAFSAVFKNSFDYSNAKRPKSGGFNVDPQLSSFAQTDEENPANRLKFQREEDFINYIEGKKDYDKNRRLSLSNFRKAQDQRTISGFASAALSIGAAGLSSVTKSSVSAPNAYTEGVDQGTGEGAPYLASSERQTTYPYSNPYRKKYMMGGQVRRYASGGGVFGGDSSTDRVPAMLTGGEYVIKKQSVDKYGPDFMKALNRGRYAKFAEGGPVGYAASSGGGGSDAFKQFAAVTEKLSALVDKLSQDPKGNKNKIETLGDQGVSTVSPVYNTNITVNVASNGTTSESSDSSGSNAEDGKKLAELIKQTTLKTITEQQRNGGLLSRNN